jgi:hypothetical protein
MKNQIGKPCSDLVQISRLFGRFCEGLGGMFMSLLAVLTSQLRVLFSFCVVVGFVVHGGQVVVLRG